LAWSYFGCVDVFETNLMIYAGDLKCEGVSIINTHYLTCYSAA